MKATTEAEFKEARGTHITLDSGLTVTNFVSYFDQSGSYMNHFEATANRQPTDAEMAELFEYKIVCVSSGGGASSAPIDESPLNYTSPVNPGACLLYWAVILFVVGGFIALLYYGWLFMLNLPPFSSVSTPVIVVGTWTPWP